MKLRCLLAIALIAALAALPAWAQDESTPSFAAYEIVIDPGAQRLAAWQVEIANPTWTIVGIEGGAPPFEEPAFHDPKALQHDRIVLAAFTKPEDAQPGAQRVAIVHVMESQTASDIEKTPETRASVIAAGNGDGARIHVTVKVLPVTEVP